jgi:ATP-dependent DNA ligase
MTFAHRRHMREERPVLQPATTHAWRLIQSVPARLLYVDHVQARGRDFFEVACAHDLEGAVGKLASGRYHGDGTSTNWFKINNRTRR